MNLVFKEKITSTNIWGKENIDFLEDKSIVYTDFQTFGRGRLGRKWLGFDTENLYASIILKPQGDFSTLPVANLTQLLSIKIVDVLKKYGINSNIKWPNDIVVNIEDDGISGQKICGILAETVTISNKIKGIVIGFGLNINATKEELSKIDRPASSMSAETDKNYKVKEILEEISEKFFENYDEFMKKGFSFIKKDYLSKIKFIDKNITINMPHKSISGMVKGLDDNGAILLKKDDEIITITMGEIQ